VHIAPSRSWTLTIGLCSSSWRWYRAGSWFRRCGVILMASMLAWYLFTTLIILLMSLFRMDPLGPWRGIFHACRNGLSLASSTGYLGADVNRIWSVTAAHCWHDTVKLRYTFNYMISIALFHDSMSRIVLRQLWLIVGYSRSQSQLQSQPCQAMIG